MLWDILCAYLWTRESIQICSRESMCVCERELRIVHEKCFNLKKKIRQNNTTKSLLQKTLGTKLSYRNAFRFSLIILEKQLPCQPLIFLCVLNAIMRK